MDTCYYDGACGMCRRSARWLARIDVFGGLRMVDQTKIAADRLPVPVEAALQGMPVLTEQGVVLIGYPAVRRALMRTPLALFAWVMYLPIIAHLGVIVYGQIARRRARTCQLNPLTAHTQL